MRREKVEKPRKEITRVPSTIVAIVLAICSLAIFLCGVMRSFLSLRDYNNHGIEIDPLGQTLFGPMSVFCAIAAVAAVAALTILMYDTISPIEIIFIGLVSIPVFLLLGVISSGLIGIPGDHQVQDAIEKKLESHSYENVETLEGGDRKEDAIKQIEKKRIETGDAPSSGYKTQITYVEEDGESKYMMIGFDKDKRMFIQYEVDARDKTPTQSKRYVD